MKQIPHPRGKIKPLRGKKANPANFFENSHKTLDKKNYLCYIPGKYIVFIV
jgi:hypothetical protein